MSNPLLNARNRILPAVVTPLTDSGELDERGFEHLIDYLYGCGMGGLYVTGSTGEGIYLDPSVRRRVTEIAVAHSRGHGKVVVHVGSIAASQAIDLAKHAGGVGADAVSSIPPFVGGYSPAEVLDFYRMLGAASPVPVVGYYIPGLTGQTWSIDRLAEFLPLPNLAGFKYTHSDLYVLQRWMSRMNRDAIIYFGDDEMLCWGLQMGAHGGIGTTYNIMPKLILEIAQLCAESRFAEAQQVQRKANEVIEALCSVPTVPATKQVLVWQGHLAAARCAPPRALLTDEQSALLRRRISQTAIADSLVR